MNLNSTYHSTHYCWVYIYLPTYLFIFIAPVHLQPNFSWTISVYLSIYPHASNSPPTLFFMDLTMAPPSLRTFVTNCLYWCFTLEDDLSQWTLTSSSNSSDVCLPELRRSSLSSMNCKRTARLEKWRNLKSYCSVYQYCLITSCF